MKFVGENLKKKKKKRIGKKEKISKSVIIMMMDPKSKLFVSFCCQQLLPK